ncbi:MAG: ATP-dependent 6-phosphofructokinase [Candidatus Helarchaeota archaeon]|nr:ATP-dependent 6-phosphofructokinase [Candidatus Helarchaeota archaeon]
MGIKIKMFNSQLPKEIMNFKLRDYVGILTSGGPAPGLNATIQAFVYAAYEKSIGVIGFHDGYLGLLENNFSILVPEALDPNRTHISSINDINVIGVTRILYQPGSILRNSRTNLMRIEGGIEKAKQNYDNLGLKAVACLGGDDTLAVANELYKNEVNVVGAPKTIDNDVVGTDYCFGFDTAINALSKFIRDLEYDARSTNGVLVVEAMGRRAGWIALEGGAAGGAHVILIPELYRAKVEDPELYPDLAEYRNMQFNVDSVIEIIKHRINRGKNYTIICVAEGYTDEILEKVIEKESKDIPKDEFGHIRLDILGVGKIIADYIAKKLNVRTRAVQTGYLSRSSQTSAFDAYMSINYGIYLLNMILVGNYGKMVAMESARFVIKDLSVAVGKIRYVQPWRFKNISKFWSWTLTG